MRSFLYFLSSSKKIATTLAAIAVGGTILHYSVIKSYLTPDEKIPDSLKDLDKAKFSLEELKDEIKGTKDLELPKSPFNDDYLDEAKNQDLIPLLSPRLSAMIPEVLKEKSKIKNPHNRNYDFFSEKKEIFKDARNLAKYTGDLTKEYVSLNPEDITFYSRHFQEEVNKFDANMLYYDILQGLTLSSKISNLVIPPESIDLNLELEKDTTSKETFQNIQAPFPASYVNFFKFSFTLINPLYSDQLFWNEINIKARTKVEIDIFLKRGALRPMSTLLNGYGGQSSSWKIIPEKCDWEVHKKTVFPEIQNEEIQVNKNFHPFPQSFANFFKHNPGKNGREPIVKPQVTYDDLKMYADPLLEKRLTQDAIKKDVEYWYGVYTTFVLKNLFDDIIKVLNIAQKPFTPDASGKNVSILDNFLTNVSVRNMLYSHFSFPLDVRLVFENFFSEKASSKTRFTIKDLKNWIKSLRNSIKKLAENLKYSFEWKTNPTWDTLNKTASLSFQITIQYTAEEKWSLPFKGVWNGEKQEVEEWTESKKEEEGAFNIEEKISDLSAVLSTVSPKLEAKLASTAFSKLNLLTVLLPDLQNFVGWSELYLNKNQNIKFFYTVENSKIFFCPTVSNFTPDPNHFGGGILGWKAETADLTVDISEFSDLLGSLWEKKIGEFRGDKNKEGLKEKFLMTDLINKDKVIEKIKKNPFSMVLHILYSLLDTNYSVDSTETRTDTKADRPLHTFFRFLLNRPIKIPESGLYVGLSSVFYKNSTIDGVKADGQIVKGASGENWTFKTGRTDVYESVEFYDTAYDQKLYARIRAWFPSYGSFGPKNFLMFNRYSFGELNTFQKWAESTVPDNNSFFENSSQLVDILRESMTDDREAVHEYFVPHSRLASENFDWSAARVRFVRLEVLNAIRNVLSRQTGVGFFGQIGLNSKSIDWLSISGSFIPRDFFLFSIAFPGRGAGVLRATNLIRPNIWYTPESSFHGFINMRTDLCGLDLGSVNLGGVGKRLNYKSKNYCF